jgi:hypothetical protein
VKQNRLPIGKEIKGRKVREGKNLPWIRWILTGLYIFH